MPFWSGETLKSRLQNVVSPADASCIDCAAYTLKVGAEYYVTPTDRTSDPRAVTVKRLAPGEAFPIPAGQFAYILTEEVVTVPNNAIAFISIRARIKFRGLINVSGFHVDPGFSDRFTFAVFNAGPVTVHLRRGDPSFLIWFADLDRDATAYAKTARAPSEHLDMNVISQVAGEVYSLQGLADRIKGTEKELGQRLTALERANGVIAVIGAAIVAVLVGLAVQWIVRSISPPPSAANAAGAHPVSAADHVGTVGDPPTKALPSGANAAPSPSVANGNTKP
jgi:dCTP deaminase